MRRICVFIGCLLMAASGYSGQQDDPFAGIFDGNYPSVGISEFLKINSVPPPAEPLPPEIIFQGKTAEEVLSQCEDSDNKGLMPSPQQIQWLIHRDYGELPNKEQQQKIDGALFLLMQTKFGKDICNSVAFNCTPADIKKAGISIRIKEYENTGDALGETPRPIRYAGNIHIGVVKGFIDGPNMDINWLAITLAHEMSHVEDLKQNRLGTLDKVRYATEEKALMDTVAIYDEISRAHPESGDLLYDLLVDVWKWKNEGGAPPRHGVITIKIDHKNRTMTSENMIRTYFKPIFSFKEVIPNWTQARYRQYFGSVSEDPKIVAEINRKTQSKYETYGNWRKAMALPPPPLPHPQPQPVPHPQPVPNPVPPTSTPQPQPVLSVSETSLNFYGQEGQDDPPLKKIGIRNSGGGTLNWEVRSNADWLSVSPASGSSTGETDYVMVDVDISGLHEGTYRAEISVSAGSLTQTVNVKLIVEASEGGSPGGSSNPGAPNGPDFGGGTGLDNPGAGSF